MYLSASRLRCLARVVKRWLKWRGQQRPDMGEDCPEKIDLEFIRWVLWTQRDHLARTTARLQVVAPATPVTVIRSTADAGELLVMLKGD